MIMPATTCDNDLRKGRVTVEEDSAASRADGASPSDEHDELHQLGERIADFAASINAAEGRMMALLADFDRRGGWKGDFGSCAEWLAWRAGTKIGPAREPEVGAVLMRALEAAADALYRREERAGEEVRQDKRIPEPAAETSRRMACDAAVVEMVHGKPETRGPSASGRMLSVGRKTRTVPPHIRRALEERDRGCRFPGCASRFTEAHHVRHRADGGETKLSNLLLLCRRHHRAVHEGRVRVCTDRAGLALFFTRKGRAMADAPEATGMIGSGAPANLPAVASGPFSNGAAMYRDSDVPWATEAAAREAVEETR